MLLLIKTAQHNSPQRKTIRKGVQVASCFQEFDELLITKLTPNHDVNVIVESPNHNVNVIVESPNHNVNVIVESDPIEILCKKMNKLNPVELVEFRQLLTEYKDVFSVSNDIIGRTDISTFDIDTTNIHPGSVPLRRVPIHHHNIARELVDKYESLGLLEPIVSNLTYCGIVHLKKTRTQVDKSNALHERACRIIYNNVRRTIRSPESTNKTKALTIVRKCIEGSICDNFRNYFKIMNHKEIREIRALHLAYRD